MGIEGVFDKEINFRKRLFMGFICKFTNIIIHKKFVLIFVQLIKFVS